MGYAVSAGMSVFTLFAVAGFKRSPWVVVAALASHGVFDFFHAHIVKNPGVPEWWPAFCLSFDVGMAAFLAWLLLTRLDPGTIPDRRVTLKGGQPEC